MDFSSGIRVVSVFKKGYFRNLCNKTTTNCELGEVLLSDEEGDTQKNLINDIFTTTMCLTTMCMTLKITKGLICWKSTRRLPMIATKISTTNHLLSTIIWTMHHSFFYQFWDLFTHIINCFLGGLCIIRVPLIITYSLHPFFNLFPKWEDT